MALRKRRTRKMHSISARLQRIGCRVLVPALLLWFGGISFMSCCAPEASAGSTYNLQGQAAESGSSLSEDGQAAHCVKKEDCCSGETSKVYALGPLNHCGKQFNGPMPCCSRSGQPADRARRSRLAPEEREDALLKNETARISQSKPIVSSRATTIRARDRSGTYLRDCVFLI
jgi:hypothetical protein